MHNNDTICAVSTPHGTGGIAVIRISGPRTKEIVSRIWKGKDLTGMKSHTVHLGFIMDGGNPLDESIATIYDAPNSFTGEDVIELSVHGSMYVQKRLLQLLTENGCRMAQAGEFTRRAFLSGKLDLAQVEGVADLISSKSKAAHRIAMTQMRGAYSQKLEEIRTRLLKFASLIELELDFSEEDVEFASRERLLAEVNETIEIVGKLTKSFYAGNAIKNGIPVAIIGETNAGKSTLLNKLVGDDRAIVSDIHGTTRDSIEEQLDIDGTTFRIIDTAGIRFTDDPIESIGISKTLDRIKEAQIIIWMIDVTSENDIQDVYEKIKDNIPAESHLIICLNKSDVDKKYHRIKKANLYGVIDITRYKSSTIFEISAKSDNAKETIEYELGLHAHSMEFDEEDIMVSNIRHFKALNEARKSLESVKVSIKSALSPDLIAMDLREAISHLGSITGQITTSDILQSIFTHFCIGK